MKNQLQVFGFEGEEVRVMMMNSNPWFIGRDVATALGYLNPRDAISKHVDERDKDVAKCDTLGGVQKLTIISESGVYALVFGSKLESAKKFQRWVTSEVLPTIRKTGGYVSNEEMFVETYFPNMDEAAKCVMIRSLKDVREQREINENQKRELDHKQDVINGLAEGITLEDKRQLLNRIVRKGGIHNIADRWNRLYSFYEGKKHINLKTRIEGYNKRNKKNFSKLDYVDKVLKDIDGLFQVAMKLYEADAKELAKKMFGVDL